MWKLSRGFKTMMTAFSRKSSRHKLCLFNILLLLNICLLSLGLLLSFMYVDRNSLPVPDHQFFLKNVPNKGMKDITQNSDVDIKRRFLTKAEYPLTLTAPFVIESPHICKGNVSVLIIVHTAPDHFHSRSVLRQSIGNVNLFKKKYSVRIAFFLGRTEGLQNKKMIKEEYAKNGDIVMGDFLDSYHNLTLKGVLAFRWATHHCSHAKLVVKMDDDIFVNIFSVLADYVPKYSTRKQQILCNQMYPLRIIRYRSKWRVSDDLFRGYKFYPPFCSGFTVIMTTDMVRVLYKAAEITPVFWVDDVYLFGLLPSKLNITQVEINNNVSMDLRRCEYSYKHSTKHNVLACTAPRPNYFETFWNKTLETLPPSMKELVNDSILTDGLLTRVRRLRGTERWHIW